MTQDEKTMTLDEYQAHARRSAEPTRNLAVLGLGLAGESGEVADHIKKHLAHGHELGRDKVAKELGDVLWYVAMTADAVGFTLCEIAQKNVEKLQKRYPNGFNEEASRNRVE